MLKTKRQLCGLRARSLALSLQNSHSGPKDYADPEKKTLSIYAYLDRLPISTRDNPGGYLVFLQRNYYKPGLLLSRSG
jgi:hypothetical protein